ncbi:hypothetical protein ASN18_0046 [Candidatus Magnetominusculus xianensis]|uniref:Uncharacterized protein n=1 Tax=Candidatus Magnetominusculus xianensis TaxID=1748249 RepID=A0ABR5SL06_9BACT|nr:hypothetical protein ASN18_0046 [Candidatus Magnetominusculus xianensis]
MNRRSDSPLQYLYENRFLLVRALFYLWLILAFYWLYCLWGIECVEIKSLKFAHKLREGDEEGISARSALAFILWALTSGIFLTGVVIFIVKFAYNCIMDTIKGVVPRKTQDFVVPIILVVLLWPCFVYKVEIKSAYRTLSLQAAEIVTMALGYEVKLKRSDSIKMRDSAFSGAEELANGK